MLILSCHRNLILSLRPTVMSDITIVKTVKATDSANILSYYFKTLPKIWLKRYFFNRNNKWPGSLFYWTKPLDQVTGPSHWTKPLDQATGPSHWTYHWTKPLDQATGPSHWTKPLDQATGPTTGPSHWTYHWTKLLDQATGPSHWTKPLDQVLGQYFLRLDKDGWGVWQQNGDRQNTRT